MTEATGELSICGNRHFLCSAVHVKVWKHYDQLQVASPKWGFAFFCCCDIQHVCAYKCVDKCVHEARQMVLSRVKMGRFWGRNQLVHSSTPLACMCACMQVVIRTRRTAKWPNSARFHRRRGRIKHWHVHAPNLTDCDNDIDTCTCLIWLSKTIYFDTLILLN